MYPPELEIKDTTESNTSASYFDLLLSFGKDGQLRTSLYDKRDDFNFHIKTFRSWVATSHLCPPMAFLSQNSSDMPGLAPLMNVLFWERRDFTTSFSGRDMWTSKKIVSKKVLWPVRGSYQTIWGPPLPNVTRHSGKWPYTVRSFNDQALHQCLTQLLILTLLPNLTFYLIVRSFHRTLATGAACQQRTLTPPDTWSCPTLGLACVLMLRQIPTELVLSPDLWVLNIPRYFCFPSFPNANSKS